MFLVRSGKRSEPLLAQALEKRQSLPLVLTILGDIGNPANLPKVQSFKNDPELEVAKAARDAVEALRARSAARA
jgi:hypothetical protein